MTLLDGIDRREFEPTVICSNSVLATAVRGRGLNCLTADFPEILLVPGERRLPFIRYLRALLRLIRVSRQSGARIVFCNGGGPCQLAVPLALLLGMRSICLLYHPAPRSLHFFWLTKFVDEIIFASEFTARHTHTKTGRTGHVVYIGVDTERFSPATKRDGALRDTHHLDPDTVVFAQIGALVPPKGHELLLDAFHRIREDVPSARLFIIGSGPEEDRIRSRICGLGLAGHVTMTGYVADTVHYLRHLIDVNILASFEEGLGLVNLEASACELPNVGTDGTGIRETILDGRTGFLFPPGDARELGRQMARLATDPQLRNKLGKAGRKFVTEQFSPQQYRARIQEIMRSVSGRTS